MGDEERRSEPRVDVYSGTVEIDGERYLLKNWSAHGFSATGYSGRRKPGDVVEIKLAVSFGGVHRQYSGYAHLLRVVPEHQEIAGRLVNMDEPWSAEELARYFTKDWDED